MILMRQHRSRMHRNIRQSRKPRSHRPRLINKGLALATNPRQFFSLLTRPNRINIQRQTTLTNLTGTARSFITQGNFSSTKTLRRRRLRLLRHNRPALAQKTLASAPSHHTIVSRTQVRRTQINITTVQTMRSTAPLRQQ